ncbi:hypothetical protein [Gimesia sp.]|uniref:hypothetical protein n=1 Tax=Gimesia sp. TaxID=2024833 RepID=UPI0032EB6632
MQKLKMIWSAGLCLGMMLLCTACGGSDSPDLGNVTGTITMDGAPLADAYVTFMPDAVRASSGKTDSAGKYELVYIRDEKGAALGDHKVVVSKLVNEKETIPPNYSDETELTAQVKSGENEINFDLSSK